MTNQSAVIDRRRGTGQLILPLPPNKPRYDRRNFLVAPTNEAAWRAAQAWRESVDQSLIICGPAGAGKTHLATILAESEDAFIDWRNFSPAANNTAIKIVVIDDLPAADPRAFLSALEEIANAGLRTVLVGKGHPGEWALGFKDLRTRLEAIPRASLDQPDEALLRAVIS